MTSSVYPYSVQPATPYVLGTGHLARLFLRTIFYAFRVSRIAEESRCLLGS